MQTARQASRRVTIKDVARAADVSVTTVSNVLNGREKAMSSETLQRVREAIRTLNYHPNGIARGLVTRRSATIGLVLAEITNPLFLQALNVIEPLSREAGYNVVMCNVLSLEDERRSSRLLLERRVDGIIFLYTTQPRDDSHLYHIEMAGVPCVIVNRGTRYDAFDQINWDYEGGLVAAVEFLIQRGHRVISLLEGPPARVATAQRLRGYRRALEAHGLTYRADYVQPGDHLAPPESWVQSTMNLLRLSPRPTAIVTSDDYVAAVVMRTLRRNGLHVPQDVSVIGFDDQPFCDYLDPRLTSVRAPVLEAGRIAVELLLQRMGASQRSPEFHLLPCELIIRESAA